MLGRDFETVGQFARDKGPEVIGAFGQCPSFGLQHLKLVVKHVFVMEVFVS